MEHKSLQKWCPIYQVLTLVPSNVSCQALEQTAVNSLEV